MGVGRVFGAALGHGGAGYAYHVESIFVKPDDTSVQITWTDPCDTDWAGTKIVRKIGTHPDGVTDGVLVADCQVRNQYAQVAYLDTGLVNGTTYYYMAFGNQLTSVNVSGATALEWFQCAGNQLTTLDVSHNAALESLPCYDNQLTSLNVSRNVALILLTCFNNQLKVLDVSNNTVLRGLHCNRNRLGEAVFRIFCKGDFCEEVSDF